MSPPRRRPVLELDDPLESARAANPAAAPTVIARTPEDDGAPTEPPSTSAPAGAGEETWRAWSGASRVASFRLPDELLDELDARASGLGMPLGMTVAAALLHLFDEDDKTVLDLVDRAEATRDRARRQARRRSPTLRA